MTSVPMSSSSSAKAVSWSGSRASGFSTSDGTPARAICRANAGWVLVEVATTTPSRAGSSSARPAPAVTVATGPRGARSPASSDGASGCSAADDLVHRDREPGRIAPHQYDLVDPGGLRQVAGVHDADPPRPQDSDAHGPQILPVGSEVT